MNKMQPFDVSQAQTAMLREVPEGYRWELIAEGKEWAINHDSHRCARKYCPRRAIVKLLRKQGHSWRWWYYCEVHMYGRVVDEGVVKSYRLVPIKDAL